MTFSEFSRDARLLWPVGGSEQRLRKVDTLERIYYINPENPFADFVSWKSLYIVQSIYEGGTGII